MKNLIIMIAFLAIQLTSFSQSLYPVSLEGEVVFSEEQVRITKAEAEKAKSNPGSVIYIEDGMGRELIMTDVFKGKFREKRTKAIIFDGEKIKVTKVPSKTRETKEEIFWVVVFLWFSLFSFLFILITDFLFPKDNMTLKVFGILFGIISIIGLASSGTTIHVTESVGILVAMTISSFFLFGLSRSRSVNKKIKKLCPYFYLVCLLFTFLVIYF